MVSVGGHEAEEGGEGGGGGGGYNQHVIEVLLITEHRCDGEINGDRSQATFCVSKVETLGPSLSREI